MSKLTEFIVVPAAPGDAGALGQVHVQAWRETYPGMLPQPYLDGMSAAAHARRFWRQLVRPTGREVLLAAEDGRGLVGYAAGAVAADATAEIQTLYLIRRAQGVGLGRRLMTDATRVLKAQGATSLVIWVLTANAPARQFYERLGGRIVRQKEEPGPGGVNRQTAYAWSDLEGLTAVSS